jgi:two-component system LytT family sensor kinase
LKNKQLAKVLIYSTVATLIFKLAFFRWNEFLHWDLFFILAIILFLWYGNVAIDQWLNKHIPWIKQSQKRLILQITYNTLFTTITLFIMMYLIHQVKFGDGRVINRKMVETFVPALCITYVVLAILISRQFFGALKDSMLEVERFKSESINAQMQNLKSQLNPHFLFNNLSVLTSLVQKDQDKAVDFINELSKVYRYVLENKTSELVPLNEELLFLDHYMYLLKIRFGNNVIFNVNIDASKKNTLLPPMCLQVLVENTIQHNEASQATPLQVNIHTQGYTLIIENKVQPRTDSAMSSNMGLKNIQSRYAYLTDEKIEIIHDTNVFKIILPLIKQMPIK